MATNMEESTMATNLVKQIRKATRRKFSAKEKIRVVLVGLRGELPPVLANPPEYLDLRDSHLTASSQEALDAVETAHTYKFRSTQTVPLKT